MDLVTVVVYFNTYSVFTTIFLPFLVLIEAKPALKEVETVIDEDWKNNFTMQSEAIYVAALNHNRSEYKEEVIPTQRAPTSSSVNATDKRKSREVLKIGNGEKAKVLNANIEDHEVFKVQRTPDGKLSVVYHDTEITPEVDPISEIIPHPNGSPPQDVRDTNIVFPDDKLLSVPSRISPRCAQNDQNFCTEVENYPSALLESILVAESKKYEQLFGDDLVPTVSINLTQRIDVPGEESLCSSQERLIYPQAGITKDNNWSIIVNQKNFTQGIRVEECINAGSACAMSESFPNGYKTQCKQKYIYRQLLSLNADGQVVKDLFKLPSCCKCVIISTHRFR